jgi:hypothetical protein
VLPGDRSAFIATHLWGKTWGKTLPGRDVSSFRLIVLARVLAAQILLGPTWRLSVTYGKEKVNSSILLRGSQVSGRFRSRDRPFRMPVQQQSAAVASGAELVAELEERLACRRGHDFGVDLHRDGDLAVPQDLYGHARVNVQGGQQRPGS